MHTPFPTPSLGPFLVQGAPGHPAGHTKRGLGPPRSALLAPDLVGGAGFEIPRKPGFETLVCSSSSMHPSLSGDRVRMLRYLAGHSSNSPLSLLKPRWTGSRAAAQCTLLSRLR